MQFIQKKCPRCNKIKLLNEFSLTRGRPETWCKQCRNEYYSTGEQRIKRNKRAVEWTKKNKEKSQKSYKRRVRKNKYKVLYKYSGDSKPKCACCNIDAIEFLTIDHINGGGRKHRESFNNKLDIYRWLINNNFPEGYRVLCYNCNCSLGHSKYCPHDKGYEKCTEHYANSKSNDIWFSDVNLTVENINKNERTRNNLGQFKNGINDI